MGSMLLGINNHGNIQRTIQANVNYQNYTRHIDSFMELGSNDNLITNLHDMRDKMTRLLEEGQLKDGEFNHIHLQSIIDGAMNIHVKPKKSLADISEFYTSYNNFNDVYNKISGDDK